VEAAACTEPASAGPVYSRRQPELGTLYRVVRENLRTLYAAAQDGFAGAALPPFVRQEFEGYLDCGLLSRGFAHLQCEDCHAHLLVAFSCKSRSFCPACMGRRMAQTAANLLDHVLPPTPLRQFVLTVPFELRQRLAYDGKLLSAVGRIFVDSVLGFYRRRMRAEAVTDGRSGSVTVVQRCNSDLKLNPHWHGLFVDGVYVKQADGQPVFHPLPRLCTEEVGDLMQVVRARILSHLARRGIIEAGDDLTVLDDGFAEREPALAQLAAASVAGLAPAGPELRRRPAPVALRGHPGVEITAPLSVTEMGFSLHAATRAGADDARGREALCKYILRPPLSQERLHLLPDGLVRIELRKPYRDGTYAVDMDPLSLLCRLATSIPPPRRHTVHYGGVLAPASKLRPKVVPPPAPMPAGQEVPATSRPPTHRSIYRPWCELLKRTFAEDVEKCAKCRGDSPRAGA
jgi:hypothetical protein